MPIIIIIQQKIKTVHFDLHYVKLPEDLHALTMTANNRHKTLQGRSMGGGK